jgi:hypothetical protein
MFEEIEVAFESIFLLAYRERLGKLSHAELVYPSGAERSSSAAHRAV